MSEPTIKAVAMAAPVGPPTPPPSIRVGTVTYRVTDDPDEWIRKEHAEQDKSKLGRTEHREATIWLDPDAAPTVKRQTLWHEVMHALAFAVMGARHWTNLGETADEREEAVILAWEHPTLAVLRDNPALVQYLMGDA